MFENNLGFMQGRLSPIINNKIQAFPVINWENEIKEASSIGFNLMEWTLDFDGLFDNPLMTVDGRLQILNLCNKYKFSIKSVTADCFMHKPFWKHEDSELIHHQKLFLDVVDACSKIGIHIIVVPLVDNGSITNLVELKVFSDFIADNSEYFLASNVKIAIESDFEPKKLADFVGNFDSQIFGINYDSGNSASMGFNPEDEFSKYHERIINIHFKDRVLGGTTVPFGHGDTNFYLLAKLINQAGYDKNFILQGARAGDNKHTSALLEYKKFLQDVFLKKSHG